MNNAAENTGNAIAELESEIHEIETQAAAVRARITTLRASMAATDDDLQRGRLSEAGQRERRRIFAEIGAQTRQLTLLDEQLRPLIDQRSQLQEQQAKQAVPAQVLQRLQDEIDAAADRLAKLEAKRPAVATALAKAKERREEAATLEQAERDAAEGLAKARADAFMLSPGTKKHEAAEGEIDAANVALSMAREKADTARAALPRLLAMIEDRQGDLDALDGDIKAARQVLEARTLARDMAKARDAYNAAAVALVQAAGKVNTLDRYLGRMLFQALRYEGVRSIDQRGRLDIVECLQRGALAP